MRELEYLDLGSISVTRFCNPTSFCSSERALFAQPILERRCPCGGRVCSATRLGFAFSSRHSTQRHRLQRMRTLLDSVGALCAIGRELVGGGFRPPEIQRQHFSRFICRFGVCAFLLAFQVCFGLSN